MPGEGRFVYPYPRPMATVDVVALARQSRRLAGGARGRLSVLLVRRSAAPFAGTWALPGGYLEENESPMAGAARELAEETGLAGVTLHELGFFGEPGRDPRGWTITLAFWAIVPDMAISKHWPALRPGDDASEIGWFPLADLPALAFDHAAIIRRALACL